MAGAAAMSNLCCCGHMERSHFAGGWCRICWCAIFETSVVENPGTPYPTRTVPKSYSTLRPEVPIAPPVFSVPDVPQSGQPTGDR
jgi:hypothetical protein